MSSYGLSGTKLASKSADPSFDWTAEAEKGSDLLEFADQLREEVAQNGGGRTQLWVQGVSTGDDERLAQAGFRPYRDLWRLETELPVESAGKNERLEDRGYRVRSYRKADKEEFLRVNNRAFAWHPEQGRLTSEGLHERMTEPWYDREGFLILEMDGRIAGFCWTKVHDDPPAGEIYAIAVDPDFAGQGLGMPLTHAGLEHLHHQRGMNSGMLYVESDNAPANRIYQKLGFRLGQVNRAYTAEIAG